MIKISAMYPNNEGSKFDMDYYCNNHIPMLKELLGPSLLSMTVEQGLAGVAPGSPAPYIAMGHLFFESLESFHLHTG